MSQKRKTGNFSFLLILTSLMLLTITAGQASADNALVGKWGYTVIGHATGSWYTWKTEVGTVTFNGDGTAVATYAESADNCPSAEYCKVSDTTDHTYTVNADGTFTFDGFLRIVVSDDGKTLVMDGTSIDNEQMLFVGTRMDPLKTYTNADINGDYYTGAYEHDALGNPPPMGAGQFRVHSVISTMNNGNFTSNGTLNGDGTIIPVINQQGTYSVNADGSMTINGVLKGHAGTGGFSLFSNAQGGTATDFASFVSLKKADKVYSTADLQGIWVMAGFGDRQKSVYRTEFGTITCGSTGSCTVSMKSRKSDGTSTIINMPLSMSLAADGSYNGFVFGSDMPHFSGAVGNNGNAMIVIMNTDNQSTDDRALGVAVKCSTCAGLTPSSPLYAYFSGDGLYSWNSTAWTPLTKDQPTTMLASDSSLYASFAAYGLYSWNGSAWTLLTRDQPTTMLGSGSALYADFPAWGVYSWDGATWTKLTGDHPQNMIVSGSTLYAYFTGDGLYSWNGSTWTLLTKVHQQNMVASGSTLYAFFTGDGLYSWNGTSWTLLTKDQPTTMVTSGSTLYADFAGWGVYAWNGATWTKLTSSHPTQMLTSGSTLYADFSGDGFYAWDGSTWNLLTKDHPTTMLASSSTLYADFASYGLYTWDGTTWAKLTSSHPTTMLVGPGN